MATPEKVAWYESAKDFIPEFLVVAGTTIVKLARELGSRKKLRWPRVIFVVCASMFFGNTSGFICYMMGCNIMITLSIATAFTLMSESIVEVFASRSKSTLLKLWDAGFEWIYARFKKKKK